MAVDKIAYMPLGKVVSYLIHGPHIRVSEEQAQKNKAEGLDDYFPLYARSDKVGYQGRSNKWLTAIERTFNSPRNIRGLYISLDEVVIWYWDTGNETISRKRVVSFGGVPEQILGISQSEVKTLIKSATLYSLGQQIPAEMRMQAWYKGNCFGAFTDSWSLANLEELYFDSTVLLGLKPELFQKLSSQRAVTCKEATGANGTKLYNPIKVSEFEDTRVPQIDRELASLLYKVVYSGLASKSATQETVGIPGYPRLKFIGYLYSNPLSATHASLQTLNMPNFLDIKSGLEGARQLNPNDVSNYNRRGMIQDIVSRLILQGRQAESAIFIDTGVDLYKAPFSTNMVWKFDELYLSSTFDKLKKNLLTIQYAQTQNITATPAPTAEIKAEVKVDIPPEQPRVKTIEELNEGVTNELERTLNELLANKNIKLARAALLNIRSIKGEKALKETLSQFSKEGQARYTKLVLTDN